MDQQEEPKLNPSSVLRVSQAAKLLGVHPDTLRRWEKRGWIKAVRHPVNNYRMFCWKDVIKLLGDIVE